MSFLGLGAAAVGTAGAAAAVPRTQSAQAQVEPTTPVRIDSEERDAEEDTADDEIAEKNIAEPAVIEVEPTLPTEVLAPTGLVEFDQDIAPDPVEVPQFQFRTWSSTSGKFSTDAKFVSIKDEVVTLENGSGKTIDVPLSKLSESDLTWLRAHGLSK